MAHASILLDGCFSTKQKTKYGLNKKQTNTNEETDTQTKRQTNRKQRLARGKTNFLVITLISYRHTLVVAVGNLIMKK